MSSNTNTLYDSSGDTPDWIEIYNDDDYLWNSTKTVSFIMPRFIIRFYFSK